MLYGPRTSRSRARSSSILPNSLYDLSLPFIVSSSRELPFLFSPSPKQNVQDRWSGSRLHRWLPPSQVPILRDKVPSLYSSRFVLNLHETSYPSGTHLKPRAAPVSGLLPSQIELSLSR